jgi:hypothetical protein
MPTLFFRIGWVALVVIGTNARAQQRDTATTSQPVNDSAAVKRKELKTVVVSAAKNTYIENRIDRVVINADALIASSGGNVVDVLNSAPGVMVDENGSISLKGKEGVVVYINDKPARLSGVELLNYLRSLPAGMIDKVELLSNPPAKYNADGTAIINIKTKKLKDRGLNGSVSQSAGFGRYFRSNNSLALNYRVRSFNFFMNAGFTSNNTYFKSDRERRYNPADASPAYTLLQQVQENGYDRSGNYQLGIDYDISKTTSMGWLLDGTASGYHETGHYENRFLDPGSKQDSMLVSNSRYSNRSMRHAVNYNLRHIFGAGQRELNINLDYLQFKPVANQTLASSMYNEAGSLASEYSLLTNNRFRAAIYSARADYSDTLFGSLKWEQGVQTLYSVRNNTSTYFTSSGGVLIPDDELTNSFRYREAIQAAYINLQQKFNKLTVQAGLRLESTHGSALQFNRPSKPDTSFSLHYVNLFPTAYLLYSPDSSGKQSWIFSTGRRIERPDYYDLNPSSFYFDKNTSLTGNSLLQPAFTNNLELSYTRNSGFTAGITYSATKRFITRGFKQVGEAFITVPVNVDHYTVMGTNITWPVRIARWYKLTVYQEFSQRRYQGTIFNNAVKKDDRLTTFYLKTYHQFTFSKGWSADLTTTYRSKLLLWQSSMRGLYQVHVGLQKKISRQSTITLAGNDVFHTWRIKRYIDIPNAWVYYDLTFDTQRFMLTYRYRFGKSAGSRRERKTGIEEEAGRAH